MMRRPRREGIAGRRIGCLRLPGKQRRERHGAERGPKTIKRFASSRQCVHENLVCLSGELEGRTGWSRRKIERGEIDQIGEPPAEGVVYIKRRDARRFRSSKNEDVGGDNLSWGSRTLSAAAQMKVLQVGSN